MFVVKGYKNKKPIIELPFKSEEGNYTNITDNLQH